MSRAVLVGVGGLVGSLARYWLAGAVQQLSDSSFPYGTLVVNLLGSLIIGVVISLSLERGMISAETRLLLATGFCGGFTTMSTFSYETLALIGDGQGLQALANVGGSVIGCVAAVWLGQVLGRMV
jgi:fluoride exporter